jgi:sulfonate transport system substrate-binding protein
MTHERLWRRVRIGAVAVVASVLTASTLAACGGTPAGPQADPNKPTIVVGQNGPFWQPALEASGVLKDAPYNITWATFSSGADTANSLVSKQTDAVINLGNATSLVLAANATPEWTASTVPLKNILLGADADPVNHSNAVTIVSPKANITSASDLRGKKWGYIPGSNNNAMFIYSLKKAGLTEADIQPVKIDDATGIQAVISGDIDVWSGGGYTALTALSAGAKVLWTGQDVGFNGYSVLAASPQAIADPAKGPLIADLTVRLARFFAWSKVHQTELVPVYVKANKFTEEQAKQRVQYVYDVVPVSSAIVSEQQQFADTLTGVGFLRRHVDAGQLYDDAYSADVAKAVKAG